MMVDIEVSLAERMLRVGAVERTLSNYNVRYLRMLSTGEFDDAAAEEAVKELIERRIKPFIEATGREVTGEAVETEVEEAFNSHLYVYCDPD